MFEGYSPNIFSIFHSIQNMYGPTFGKRSDVWLQPAVRHGGVKPRRERGLQVDLGTKSVRGSQENTVSKVCVIKRTLKGSPRVGGHGPSPGGTVGKVMTEERCFCL